MGLFDVFSSGPANDAAGRIQAHGQKALRQAKKFIGEGKTEALGYLDKARAPYEGLYNRSLQGWDAYADATGVGGPEGYQRAMGSFRTNPGYQFTIDEALQAINRNAAATGRLASGNTDIDVMNRVTGLADQEYDDYVARLLPFLSTANNSAGGIAGVYGAQADTAYNAGRDITNVAVGQQNRIGDAESNAKLADYQASGNMWNLGMDLAKLGMKIPGLM